MHGDSMPFWTIGPQLSESQLNESAADTYFQFLTAWSLSLCSDPRRKGTSQSVVKGILPAIITILTLSLKHRPMLLSIIVGYHYAIKHQGGWAWFPSSGCLKSLWITGPHASPSFCKQHKSTKEIELASAWLQSTHSEIQCGGKSVRSPAKVKGETITGG